MEPDVVTSELSSVVQLAAVEARLQKCQACRLCHQGATKVVPGEGNPSARIMFIGEAPGKDEDLQGRPFVGAAGKFLNSMLETIGLKREDVFITNVVKHRPPENRDPEEDEIAACYPYLREQIMAIKPLVIATLGRHAMGRFLPGLRISEVHGKAKRINGLWCERQVFFPLYHPASALYNPGLRETLIRDMKKIPVLLEKLTQ
jgi:uracil-DNA glycosylase